VSRRFHHLEPNIAEFNPVAILHVNAFELSLGSSPKVNRRSDLITEFDVSSDEVGMEVREKGRPSTTAGSS